MMTKSSGQRVGEGHGSKIRRGRRGGQRADGIVVGVLMLGWFVDLTRITGRKRKRSVRPILHQDRLSSTIATLPSACLTHHPQPSTSPGCPSLLFHSSRIRHLVYRCHSPKSYTQARVDVSSSRLVPPFSRTTPLHCIPQHGIYKPAHASSTPLPPSCGGPAYESKQSRPVTTLCFRTDYFLGGHSGEGKVQRWEHCAVFVACPMCHLMQPLLSL
ncbi:hypothetical protein JOL62DRAFT_253806 [Phyllosticta paracitricarpa]|uniref:Uncharacterized protein n=1 Tax=Phyllosticta paracitricarpa TaxID=2016321 RepID=A0ABR1N0E4_9PEZI